LLPSTDANRLRILKKIIQVSIAQNLENKEFTGLLAEQLLGSLESVDVFLAQLKATKEQRAEMYAFIVDQLKDTKYLL
jgi:hypothetical protein